MVLGGYGALLVVIPGRVAVAVESVGRSVGVGLPAADRINVKENTLTDPEPPGHPTSNGPVLTAVTIRARMLSNRHTVMAYA